MNYNREFFQIDTEQKAYLLGFAYADGCISIKKGKGNYSGRVFRMSLADEDIIYQLKKEFPFFNVTTHDYSKYNKNNRKQYCISKVNTELYNDLLFNGLLERKSGENSTKLSFPLYIKDDLLNHFIRGVFDGDGSINIAKKRPNLRRVEICSSSKNFLLQLKTKLEDNNIDCPIFREKYNNILPLYVLEWINSTDILKLKEFFYKNASIYLNRKKEKFDSFKVIDKKDENPKCPSCFFPSQKKGKRMMIHGLMYRYVCINCNKKFSIQAQLKQDELLETPTLERQKEDNQQPS